MALCANQVARELEKELPKVGEIMVCGPAPAPLLKAENFFRHQIMLRGKNMPRLSRSLTALQEKLKMPEDISMTIDIDPMNLL